MKLTFDETLAKILGKHTIVKEQRNDGSRNPTSSITPSSPVSNPQAPTATAQTQNTTSPTQNQPSMSPDQFLKIFQASIKDPKFKQVFDEIKKELTKDQENKTFQQQTQQQQNAGTQQG